jgi:hypothetical protein
MLFAAAELVSAVPDSFPNRDTHCTERPSNYKPQPVAKATQPGKGETAVSRLKLRQDVFQTFDLGNRKRDYFPLSGRL